MLEHLRQETINLPPPLYSTLRISLSDGSVMRQDQDVAIELQRINEAYKMGKHTFVYGIGTENRTPDSNLFASIVKYNTTDHQVQSFTSPHVLFGEPVFVPRKDAATEDDGYLLVLGIDTQKETSVFFGIDARTMRELFRAPLPRIITMGFHGHFREG